MIPIAITRIAAHSALGNSLEATVDALRRSEVGIRSPKSLEQTPRFDSGAGEVPFEEDGRNAWRAESLLRRTMHSLLTHGCRASIAANPSRWGIVLGTTLAGMRHCGVGMRADEAGSLDDADIAYARTCASSVLAHALGDIGITGPTITVSCACASALSAVNHACTLLELRRVDAVIAGGYDPMSEFVYGGFAALQLVAPGPLSPFARDREGMKLGEGAALFLLRRAEDLTAEQTAAARGFIVGTGESSDAHHLTQPHPAGSGAARALISALTQTEGVHRGIDLLVAHATGTPGNDGSEHEAYRAVFGDALGRVPVVALKSRFGHPLGAAGVLEVAAVMGCAEAGFVPTTAGRGRDPDAFPELDLIEGPPRAGSPRDIVVLSAGFGGANAATRIVRSEPPSHPTGALQHGAKSVVVTAAGAVSPGGRGPEALLARMNDPAEWPGFDEATLAPLLDRARTRRLALLPRLMIAAVRDLADRAGISSDELAATPLLAANWCGAADFTERYYRDLVRAGIDLANPMLFAESVPNIGSAHCSLAFGITAPSVSVIGRRTSGLEALFLAQARLLRGDWRRAIVVAAEEQHPIVARTLARCATREVPLRSGAVALLIESEQAGCEVMRRPIFTIGEIDGRTSPFVPASAGKKLLHSAVEDRAPCVTTSTAPFDDPVASQPQRMRRLNIAELGAATGLAAMLALEGEGEGIVATADPHGAFWRARILASSDA